MAGEPSSGENSCTTPSSAICCSASFSFLAFIASPSRTRRRISGAKFGTPRKQDVLALGQRVADAQRAVVGDADHVAGIGLVGGDARAGEEELRRRQAHRLAGAHQLGLHAALQLARADAHEGDAVAVVGVHVGLDLEDEGGHLLLGRLDRAGVGLLVARRRPEGAERLDQVAHAEIAQRRAEKDRRQMAFAERLQVERPAGLARQLQFLDEGVALVVGQQAGDAVGIRAVDLACAPSPRRRGAPRSRRGGRCRKRSCPGRSAR